MANKNFVPKVQPKVLKPAKGKVDPAMAYEGYKDAKEYEDGFCDIEYDEYLKMYYNENGEEREGEEK